MNKKIAIFALLSFFAARAMEQDIQTSAAALSMVQTRVPTLQTLRAQSLANTMLSDYFLEQYKEHPSHLDRLNIPADVRPAIVQEILKHPYILKYVSINSLKLTEHISGVTSVAFSPNGKLLASTSNGKTIRLWDIATGQCINTLKKRHTYSVNSVAFSPNSTSLASVSDGVTIRLWDVATGQCNTLTGHTSYVRSVAFSPNGALLASVSDGVTIRLWDVATGQCTNTLTGHTSWVNSVAFSPNGTLLASASSDNTVRLWDVATGQCINTLTGHTSWVGSVAFSPNGKLLASVSNDKTVRLWDIATGQCNTLTDANGVNSVAFSPNGTSLTSVSCDATIRLWDIATGQCISTFCISPFSCGTCSPTGHTNYIRSVAFSPNGTLLASASDDKTIRLWDVATGQCINTLTGHTSGVTLVAFSPNGTSLTSSSFDATIRLWQPDTNTNLKQLLDNINTHRINKSDNIHTQTITSIFKKKQ